MIYLLSIRNPKEYYFFSILFSCKVFGKISPKDIKELLCNYSVVEIMVHPGFLEDKSDLRGHSKTVVKHLMSPDRNKELQFVLDLKQIIKKVEENSSLSKDTPKL